MRFRPAPAGFSTKKMNPIVCSVSPSPVCMENVSRVTVSLGVTVLPNLITQKFVHQKIQKYEWIEHVSIYPHAKFELEQKFVQSETKKRNQHLNGYGGAVHV